MTNTITERFANSVELLDRKGPVDWRDRVDVKILDMTHPHRCILGQVFGSYWMGLDALGVSPFTGPEGFNVSRFTNKSDEDIEYGVLKTLWTLYLQ